MMLSAQSSFIHDDVAAIVGQVCDHLATHGVTVAGEKASRILTSSHGTCAIEIDGTRASLTVKSTTRTGIAVLEEQVAGHLIEAVPALEDHIIWTGSGAQASLPAWFCLLSVLKTTRLTPHMQRITFSGEDLQRFEGMADIHVRLMFPLGDQAPQWPTVAPNGVTRYPDPDVLAIRKYTIRDIDPIQGTIEIDFVLHDDAGPGSAFASRARPGDIIGMAGPGGRSAPLDRDWYLLAGDETALPAMARLLEAMPIEANGIALIEVADAREEIALVNRSGIEVHWLHRGPSAAGTTHQLAQAVAASEIPSASSVFVWAGCEHTTAMSIRTALHKDRQIAKKDALIVSYWRRTA